MKVALYSITQNSRMGTSLTHYLRDKGVSVQYDELSDRFKDGDLNPQAQDLEDRTVYILAMKGPRDPSDVLHGPILGTAQAAKANGAKRVIVLAPMELYGRAERGYQEDPALQGKGNMVDMVARTFKAVGIDGYLMVDSHNPTASQRTFEQYFDKPAFFNIDADYFLYRYLLYFSMVDFSGKGEKVVYVKPDKGSRQRVDTLFELTKTNYPKVSWLEVEKQRLKDNDADQLVLRLTAKSENFTACDNKTQVYSDDIAETLGTLGKNTEFLSGCNELTAEIGVPAQKIMYVTHPSFCMWYKNWDREHVKSLERILAAGFNEIITTNTLDYIHCVLNIERRGGSTSLAIGDDLKQFSESQRKLYYELQKKLTILDITPTIAKAMIYLENFESIPDKFDINEAFWDQVKGKRIAPFTFLRSHHFRDFKVRMHNDGEMVD